jgi:peptide chain release factor subunit 1
VEEVVRLKLGRLIKELEKIHGRHTELVTIYVPKGYDINLVVNQVFQEQGTAQNIKSKTTRKNVIGALEKILQELKLYKRTPENGMVIFSGNASEREGLADIKIWVIEPPEPLSTKMYRCDQEFVLEPLREMLEEKYVYGLVVVDNKNAAIGTLRGKHIECLKEMNSIVPGKFRAGGQSSTRFARLRQELAKDWYKKIADEMKRAFLDIKNLKGILMGGPGPTKETLLETGYIDERLRSKVIAVKDIGYSDSFGLQELVERSFDELSDEKYVEERKILQDFFGNLARNTGLVDYGREAVKKELGIGAVETLLLSEALDEQEILEFEALCKSYGVNMVIISKETREGQQFNEIGGIGAILRFKV